MKKRLSQKTKKTKKPKKAKKGSFAVPRLWGLAKRLEHRRIKGKQKKK